MGQGLRHIDLAATNCQPPNKNYMPLARRSEWLQRLAAGFHDSGIFGLKTEVWYGAASTSNLVTSQPAAERMVATAERNALFDNLSLQPGFRALTNIADTATYSSAFRSGLTTLKAGCNLLTAVKQLFCTVDMAIREVTGVCNQVHD